MMNVKLTRAQADEALGRLEHGETERTVAARLEVTQSCIHLIKLGKVWKDLPPFQKPPLSAQSKRCARCDKPGHHKGTCVAVLTIEEILTITKLRQLHANRKHYAPRKKQQISDVLEWRHNNPDKAKEYRRVNWERHKIRKKEERRLVRKEAYARFPKETWLKEIFRDARDRAKKLGIPYDQDIPYLELPDECPVLGIQLSYGGFRGKPKSDTPSLDRIVPELGYVKSNLRVISYRANTLKNNATLDELRRVYLYMMEATCREDNP